MEEARKMDTQETEQNANNNGRRRNMYNEINNVIMLNNETKRQICDWLCTDPFCEMLTYVQSRVMGQKEVPAVVANIYNYLRRIGETYIYPQEATRSSNNNMLMCAPSGCGKTETYRALKDYFINHIPLLLINSIDVSNITPAGFRGQEPSSIVEPFIRYGSEPVGIVFMDEFDKICTPSFTADHANVHLDVQHNLLTMVEGAMVETKQGYVNTSNLLFIGAGSFDQFRESRENKSKAGIGFMATETNETKHDAPVTRENIILAGGCYELIGRFSYIVNYYSLSREVILNIIERNRRRICEDFRCEIVIMKQVIQELCENVDSKFGCRIIDSLIRNQVLKAYSEAMQSDDRGDVLMITLDSLDTYSYRFRNYTPVEKNSNILWDTGFKNEGNVVDNEIPERMNFDEILSALIEKSSGIDVKIR